jgi:hypothetical protein
MRMEFGYGNSTSVDRLALGRGALVALGSRYCAACDHRAVLAAQVSGNPRFGKQKFVKLQAASASHIHLVSRRDACHCVGGEAKSAIKIFAFCGAPEHQSPFIATRHQRSL